MHARLRLSVTNLFVRIQRRPVRLKKVPRIADSHPFPLPKGNRPDPSPLRHQQAERVCELEFSAFGFAGLLYRCEDGVVENVDTSIDHSDTAASHLLADRDNVSPLDLQRPKARRVPDLRSAHQQILRLRGLDEFVESFLIVVVVSVDDQEAVFSLQFGLAGSYRISRPSQPLLFHVSDLATKPLTVSEEILDLFRLKLDHHHDLADPSLNQRPDCSL